MATGREFNRTLGAMLEMVNDEERVSEAELAEAEAETIVEALFDNKLNIIAIESYLERHPEYKEMNALAFYQKLFGGEFKDFERGI